MPQLSPLNWIFLFFLFWAAIFCFFAVIWWSSKVEFTMEEEGNMKSDVVQEMEESKWMW
uniref:ATP synthase F0 subunit 8 n=2 Tax=Batillaria TaxID=75120 RepID=D6RTN5_9CAEN|nr:ATP synthase F0 subunit 8 [Batillaria attramentaria]QIM14731.1 ATP synthase F0 subunit 8 [Batillaria attramentaria]BAJ09679.1 ATP synthase F0 subunit 8 [Batillaria cumingii]